MRFLPSQRVRLVSLAAVATALMAGGIAYASIPDANGVIHGCYNPSGAKSSAGTSLNVIDSPYTCAKGLQAITWNQQGPKGATGARGPTGMNGTNGTNGKNGVTGPTGPTGQRGPTGADGSSGSGTMLTGSTGTSNLSTAAGLSYIGASFVTTDFATAAQIISVSGTLGTFMVHVRDSPGSSGEWDFQLVLDGQPVDDCQIGGSATECTGFATNHPAVAPGDTLTVFSQDVGEQSGTPASWAVTIN